MSENTFRSITMVVLIIGLMIATYMAGYYKRANDMTKRINTIENMDEGCFTREEVDYFIYGD